MSTVSINSKTRIPEYGGYKDFDWDNREEEGHDWEQLDELYSEPGLTNVERTVHYYPHLARKGFCFAFNKDRKINGRLLNSKELKKRERDATKCFEHFHSSFGLAALSEKAFWSDGKKDPKMFPVFVRVEREDILEELGYEQKPKEWNRFILMDLGEDE